MDQGRSGNWNSSPLMTTHIGVDVACARAMLSSDHVQCRRWTAGRRASHQITCSTVGGGRVRASKVSMVTRCAASVPPDQMHMTPAEAARINRFCRKRKHGFISHRNKREAESAVISTVDGCHHWWRWVICNRLTLMGAEVKMPGVERIARSHRPHGGYLGA
ncbi:unnamed protein product [Mycena citricolor]|uniref:Uncharacterized protein n=1 Tax=Mycena citricolor TaxID=2018698 RepID=A0AAD2HD51_9AGAR|nr:unnamed protein product [Mycena citricolor]